jgi:hypothetical protein
MKLTSETINNLIFPLVGTIAGALLTYKFTERFEKKRLKIDVKIGLLRDFLSLSDEIEKSSIKANNLLVNGIIEGSFSSDYINSLLISFLENSNLLCSNIELNKIFFKENLKLFDILEVYDRERSIFYTRYKYILQRLHKDNIEELNDLLSNFLSTGYKLKENINEILIKLI